jgi:hypothetical protein
MIGKQRSRWFASQSVKIPEMQPLDNVLPCPDDPIVQGICLESIFSCGVLQ